MICMSTKTEAFLPTNAYEVDWPILIMYLSMASHISFLGEWVPTIWECANIRSFKSVRPYMIQKFTISFMKLVTTLTFLALINILKIIYFGYRSKLENQIVWCLEHLWLRSFEFLNKIFALNYFNLHI